MCRPAEREVRLPCREVYHFMGKRATPADAVPFWAERYYYRIVYYPAKQSITVQSIAPPYCLKFHTLYHHVEQCTSVHSIVLCTTLQGIVLTYRTILLYGQRTTLATLHGQAHQPSEHCTTLNSGLPISMRKCRPMSERFTTLWMHIPLYRAM